MVRSSSARSGSPRQPSARSARSASTLARSTLASVSSTWKAAVTRFAYFCAMVSPCSVTRSEKSSAPGGVPFKKRCVGPAPRLIEPPRP
jgi:hypothetical protein